MTAYELSPFTGFGDDPNTSVKFRLQRSAGRLPDWRGGPRLTQFVVPHSDRTITQHGGRDPWTVTFRLWFATVADLELLDALQGSRATLRYRAGLTKRVGGTVTMLGDVAYLVLPGTLLAVLSDVVVEVDGSCEATATFERPYVALAVPEPPVFPPPPPPTPFHLTAPDSHLMRVAPVDTTWETPDATGVVVHPSVRYFAAPWHGSHWWAAATPYYATNSAVENPCIYVSADGSSWVAPDGVTNPLVPNPGGGGYNSDVNLVMAPDRSELLLYFREYVGTTASIKLLRSVDGVTWTGPTTVLSTSAFVSDLLSPAVWFDPRSQQWVMLGAEDVANPNVIWRYTSSAPEGPWVFDDVVTVAPAWPSGAAIWHLDAQPMGAQVVLLAQTGNSGGGSTYLAVSNDSGQSFTASTIPAVQHNGYKGAILPRSDDGVSLAFDVWLGKVGANWGVERGVLVPSVETANDMAGATGYTASPYLFGDTFDRADASGLGTSSSGHAWTANTGTFLIASNKATASSNARSLVDPATEDVEIGVTLDTGGSGEGYLIYRFSDGDNFYRFGVNGTTISLQRITGGGVGAQLAIFEGRPATPFRLVVRTVGTTHTAWVDGSLLWTGTQAQGAADTSLGLQVFGGTTCDNIWVRPAGSGPDPW